MAFLNLFGMRDRDDFFSAMNRHYRNTKQGRQLDTIEMYDKAMEGMRRKIASLDEELHKTSSENPEITKRKESCEKLLKNIEGLETVFLQNIADDSTDRKIGILLANLFAGPDRMNNLNEEEISGIWSGLAQGLTVPAGEVMKEKVKATINNYVGSTWDFLFTKLGDFFNKIRNILFHGSNEPFDSQALDGWQKIITCAYNDINNMLSGVSRDSSRRLDSVSRQFDDDSSDVERVRSIDMWASLVAGYAEQFSFFITIFEKHVEYYDPGDIVVFYSHQICQMLQTTANLLLSSRSLKDLDSKLESQKTIILSIQKNIYNLFEQLKFEITPRSYSMKDKASSTPTYKPTPYNPYAGGGYATGYGSDMPTSYSQYSGCGT
jgi:hypothetical protein